MLSRTQSCPGTAGLEVSSAVSPARIPCADGHCSFIKMFRLKNPRQGCPTGSAHSACLVGAGVLLPMAVQQLAVLPVLLPASHVYTLLQRGLGSDLAILASR